LENEKLVSLAGATADTIDRVFAEEQKIALSLSMDPDIVAAAEATAAPPAAVVPAVKGRKAAPVGPNTAELVARVDGKLATMAATKGFGESYQGLLIIGPDGKCFSSSDSQFIGVDFSERGYFKTAMTGKVNAGAAARNKVTNKPFTPFAAPIRSGDTVVGVVALIADIGFLNDIVADQKVGKTGYACVLDNSGLVIAHPSAQVVFTLDISKVAGMEDLARKISGGQRGVDGYVYQGVAKTAGYAPVKATGWSVLMTLPDSEFPSTNEVRNIVAIISVIALVLASLIYALFARTITRKLAYGVTFAQQVASGDFSQQLPILQHDEIGALGEALNSMTRKLSQMVAAVQNNAEQVAASSEEISASTQKLAEGAQSQASSLEETSASVEELTASVEQVAEHAQSQAAAAEQGTSSMTQVRGSIEQVSKNLSQIGTLSIQSVDKADEGAKAVDQVVEGINRIAQSSEKIGGIATVIADIADQTNLLALNASIEAARAGEHGRGFAVVAGEVSKLAERSLSATKEIEALVKEGKMSVADGVKAATGSQAAMGQIREASQHVRQMIASLTEAMEQQVTAVQELSTALGSISEMSQSISAATEEQTTNAKQVSTTVESINEVTQGAASAAEQMSAATEQLAGMAEQLQNLMAQFKIVHEGANSALQPAGHGEDPRDGNNNEKSTEAVPLSLARTA
jgi:methyl-accepting chemotaxis protein